MNAGRSHRQPAKRILTEFKIMCLMFCRLRWAEANGATEFLPS